MPSKPNSAAWWKILLLLAVIGGAVVASRHLSRDQINALIERARNIGPAGYFLFVLGYGAWCALGLPASLLTLAAAAAFGFSRGLLLVLCGANFGALLGFLIARHLARDWFSELVGRKIAFAQINRAVAESGWKVVMLTRLPPVSPFSILNYAYGLTHVSLRDYFVGTALGMIPGTTAYVYLGTILGNVAQGSNRERTPLEWTFYIAGFVVTVVVCIYLVRLARNALDRRLTEK